MKSASGRTGRGLIRLFDNMFSAIVTRRPVTIGQFIDADSLAGAGMDKLAIAEIDSTMGSAGFIGSEKYQIAWNQLTAVGSPAAQLVLLVSSPGDFYPVLSENVLQVSGTIESLGCVAAKFIRNADIGLGRANDRVYLARS